MINYLLYAITVLVWGSTWLAIHFQIGSVAPTWSVAYRFGIATAILFAYCLLTKLNLKFSRREHAAMALQGMLLFSINYILYYVGSMYFVSGLLSVIFATIIIMNIINSRIFFKTPLVPQVIFGAVLGLCGLGVVFSSQWQSFHLEQYGLRHLLLGLAVSFTATLTASFGNMASLYNQKLKLPIIQSNAYGMFYGTIIVVIIALVLGHKPTFDYSTQYVGSLLYLAIIGTVLAFGAYLQLLGRIGPERASYAFVLLPIVALGLSTGFEGFQWNIMTVAGMVLVVIGNGLVLLAKSKRAITKAQET